MHIRIRGGPTPEQTQIEINGRPAEGIVATAILIDCRGPGKHTVKLEYDFSNTDIEMGVTDFEQYATIHGVRYKLEIASPSVVDLNTVYPASQTRRPV